MGSQCTPVHGVLETHQLSTGKSPLLLSLHAQAHLGLVKNLKNSTVSIDGNQLPVLRCSHTGFMMLAIIPNQLDPTGKTFHNSSQQIPKCHRKFRAAFTAVSDAPSPMNASKTATGFHHSSTSAVESALDQALRGLNRSNVLIVTSGARWTNRQPAMNGVTVLQIDCRHFHDPDNDRTLRGHVGRHPGIMRSLARNSPMEELLEQVKDFLKSNPSGKLVIHLYCTSGRHRSVGVATVMFHFLDVSEEKPRTDSFSQPGVE